MMKKIMMILGMLVLMTIILSGCVSNEVPVEIEEEKIVALSATEKKAIYYGTYGKEASENSSNTYYGVGRTINVVTDPWINISSGHAKVFDTDKLLGLNWHKTFRGEISSYTVSGSSMEKFYNNFNSEIKSSVSGGIKSDIFSSTLENKFGLFAGITYSKTANEIIFSASQIYKAHLIEIDEYYNLSQFSSILSNDIVQDAEALEKGLLKPESFVYKYGTHVVLAGYYGGRVDANYYMQNLDKQWSAAVAFNYQNKVGNEILKIFSNNISTDFSIKNELGITSNQVNEQFTASSIGGDNFSAISLADFLANYNDWASSMNGKEDYSNLVDLPQRSLVAIWDILPDKYAGAKQTLSNYFNDYANAASDEFLSKYSRYYTEPEDKGDTSNFSGGFGTINQPYLISDRRQFQNINAKGYLNKHFKLLNSIDLGIWNTPFLFSGELDGNGFTISFTQTINTKGNYLGGLFTQLEGATVKNLNLDVIISRDLDRKDIGMVGGLAGKTTGITNIYRVAVKGNIVIGNYSGYDYIGGIVGQFLGGEIRECFNQADVTNKARNARTGGIAGYASPQEMPITILNCYNTGNLLSSSNWTTAFGGRASGGIIGQARGHNAFALKMAYCYNDSKVDLQWTGVSTGGWFGRGGLVGDIEKGYSENININHSYWNSVKCKPSGNNSKYHKNNGKTSMAGVFEDWPTDIWVFSSSKAPRLKWQNI